MKLIPFVASAITFALLSSSTYAGQCQELKHVLKQGNTFDLADYKTKVAPIVGKSDSDDQICEMVDEGKTISSKVEQAVSGVPGSEWKFTRSFRKVKGICKITISNVNCGRTM